jgi:glycosyltransferase involved in cell wall biosynthesis
MKYVENSKANFAKRWYVLVHRKSCLDHIKDKIVKFKMISVLMSIFNKENILSTILSSMFENTSTAVTEYIFVLDGCTDSSEKILLDFSKNNAGKSIKIFKTNDVFELRSNNRGLRECSNEYCIIIQDDMQIMEPNWDCKMLRAISHFDDVWAVTGRTALNISPRYPAEVWADKCEGPVGHNYSESAFDNLERNKIYIRQIVNRGPLMVKMNVIREMGFFDESLPGVIGCDDADLCFRTFKKTGLKCGSYPIAYYSPLHWGATRSGPNSSFCVSQENLNLEEVVKRHRSVIDSWTGNETRELAD